MTSKYLALVPIIPKESRLTYIAVSSLQLGEKWKLSTQSRHGPGILAFSSKTYISSGLLSAWSTFHQLSQVQNLQFVLNFSCRFRQCPPIDSASRNVPTPSSFLHLHQQHPSLCLHHVLSSHLQGMSSWSSCFPSCYPTIHFCNGNHDNLNENFKMQTNPVPPCFS